MTQILSILTDAYRETNMIPLGKVPADNMVAEALRLYNQLLASMYGSEIGENLNDWPLGEFGREIPDACVNADVEHHPLPNRRLIAVNEAAVTVFLSPMPQDGARMALVDPFSRLADVPVTINANGRVIEGQPAVTLDTNGLEAEWLYRADKAAWVRITNLLATDDNPFPVKYDGMFAILLAMRLNPRYGRQLTPESTDVLKKLRTDFIARYLQDAVLQADDSISWPFMSKQDYQWGRNFSSSAAFARGSYRGS